MKKVWRYSAVFSALPTTALFCIPAAIGAKALKLPLWYGVGAGALVAIGIMALSISFVDRQWKNWTYELREGDLVLNWGVLWKTRRCVARDRVQHVDINEGPLDRRFGLVQLSIYAVGQIGTIPGLSPQEAEFLKEQLLLTSAREIGT